MTPPVADTHPPPADAMVGSVVGRLLRAAAPETSAAAAAAAVAAAAAERWAYRTVSKADRKGLAPARWLGRLRGAAAG